MKATLSRSKAASAKSRPLAGEEIKRIRIRKAGLRVRVRGAVRGKPGRVTTFGYPVDLEFSPQEYASVVRTVQAELEAEDLSNTATRKRSRKGRLQARCNARLARRGLQRRKTSKNTSVPEPIEEVLARLAREVPAKEWEKLPPDLSENLDHYLYGSPKR